MNSESFRWRSLCPCGGVVAEVIEPAGVEGAALSANYVSFGGRFKAEPTHVSPCGERPACQCRASLDARQVFADVEEVFAGLRHLARGPMGELTLRRAILTHVPDRPKALDTGRARLRSLQGVQQITVMPVAELRKAISERIDALKKKEKAG